MALATGLEFRGDELLSGLVRSFDDADNISLQRVATTLMILENTSSLEEYLIYLQKEKVDVYGKI